MKTVSWKRYEMTICNRDIVVHIPKLEMLDIRLLPLIPMVEHYRTSPLVVSEDQQQILRRYENIDQ